MECVTLQNGINMPMIGFGTWDLRGKDCERAVLDAFEVGYRLIDTAQMYRNEREVGNAIQKSNINCEMIPMVNQVEAHIFFRQKSLQETMEKQGTIMEAWSPLAAGKKRIFENPILIHIGQKYHKTPAQIALRYLVQNHIIVIPKSSHKER